MINSFEDYDNIICLGCSFTQMKAFFWNDEKNKFDFEKYADPDWTERLGEYFDINVINAGNSGHSNAQMELQYLKTKAKLNPNDKNLVIGGLTHTGRIFTRGYAGLTVFRGDEGEDAFGTNQWKKFVADDGLVWQMLVDIGCLAKTVQDYDDDLLLFSNHCEVQSQTVLQHTLRYLQKYSPHIHWGQSTTNLQNNLRLCFDILNDNFCRELPDEYKSIRQYQIDLNNISKFDDEEYYLKKIAKIINNNSTNGFDEDYLEHIKISRGFDFGWNFNHIINYCEDNPNTPYLKVTTQRDAHPNNIGSDIVAEILIYNICNKFGLKTPKEYKFSQFFAKKT